MPKRRKEDVMLLTKEELLKVNGGAINWTAISIIGSIVTFITGLVDGYLRPIKCH